MKNSKLHSTVYTAIINTFNSFLSIIIGLIFSKLLLLNYGSEINGLISSITQFVSFFTVLEGGLTTAAIVSIYRPLLDKNYGKLNSILYTAKKKFLNIGLIISILVLLLGSIYLLFIDLSMSYFSCFILIIICLIQTFLSISVESKYTILLYGDNKEYKVTLLKIISRLIGWAFSIILILNKCSIVLVYSTYLITSLLNIVLVRNYEKKAYSFVNYKGEYEPELISGTNDLMIQKIANTIFSSTDIFLISIIINFAVASVYSVYNLIYKSITQIVRAFVASPFNSLGQLLNSKDVSSDRVQKISKMYDTLSITTITIVLMITAICTIPFVKLYTSGITDVNYVDKYLVLLFFSNSFFQLSNQSSASIINASGLFKYQNKICIIAAISNLVLSIILGNVIGIYGILLGSFISYIMITFYDIVICNKKILNVKSFNKIFIIVLNYSLSLLVIYFVMDIFTVSSSYIFLILQALLVSICVVILIITFNLIINYKGLKLLYSYFIKKV